MEIVINDKLVQLVSGILGTISSMFAIFQFFLAIRERAQQERESGMGSAVGLFALSTLSAIVGALFAYVVINPRVADRVVAQVKPKPTPISLPSPRDTSEKQTLGWNSLAEPPNASDVLPESEILQYVVHPSTIGLRWPELAEQIGPVHITDFNDQTDPTGAFRQQVKLDGCALIISINASGNVSRITSSPTKECLAAWERIIPQFEALSTNYFGNYDKTNPMIATPMVHPEPIKLKDFMQTSTGIDVVGINGSLDNDRQSQSGRYIELVTQLSNLSSDPSKGVKLENQGQSPTLTIVRTRFSRTQSQPDFSRISRKLRGPIIQGRLTNGRCDPRYMKNIARELGDQEIEEIELTSFDPRLLCPQ